MILIFEDNRELAMVLKAMLGRFFNEKCVITSQFREAENLVLCGDVSLVLSDLDIEGHGRLGLEFIRKLRKIMPHSLPPIIVYTGINDTDPDFTEAKRLSDDIYEKSDISLVQLRRGIGRLLKIAC